MPHRLPVAALRCCLQLLLHGLEVAQLLCRQVRAAGHGLAAPAHWRQLRQLQRHWHGTVVAQEAQAEPEARLLAACFGSAASVESLRSDAWRGADTPVPWGG